MAIDLNSSPIDPQSQSPLFTVLPGELRNEIFALALMQYEDDESSYKQDSYWFRPGFKAPHKSNSSLLRTCRAAYAEGQKVFLRELEWAFWFDRGPNGRTGNNACKRFFGNLNPQAAQSLQKVRFFTQMYWLEGGRNLRALLSLPQFCPVQVTITIRYSDWWWWEDNAPLTMNEDWLRQFEGNPELRVLRVEYETLAVKKDEMMRIIQRNKKWRLPIRKVRAKVPERDFFYSEDYDEEYSDEYDSDVEDSFGEDSDGEVSDGEQSQFGREELEVDQSDSEELQGEEGSDAAEPQIEDHQQEDSQMEDYQVEDSQMEDSQMMDSGAEGTELSRDSPAGESEAKEPDNDGPQYIGYLSAERTELVESKWRGTSKLGGQTWSHHGPGDTVEYVVVTDTWIFVEGEMDGRMNP